MSNRRNAVLWFVAISVLIAVAFSRLSSGNITILSDLLSLVGQKSLFDDKIREAAGSQQQKLIIVVSARDQQKAQTSSKQLATDLAALDSIKSATRLPFDQGLINQLTALYQNYPFTLLNKEYFRAINDNEPDKLNEYFLSSLLQPGNPFVDLTINHDPTLGLANALMEKMGDQSQWSNDGDALYQLVDKQYYYPLFVELTQSKLGVNQSVEIEKHIQALLTTLDDDINVYRSGLLFHIAQSTVQAQGEITLFGMISSIIILTATLAVFRSLTPLLVIVVIMSVSIAFGTAGLMSFVDEIHLITFIFAVSLIGISVDYAFHVLAAAALLTHEKQPKIKQSLAKYLAPAMLMGAITTVLGYCAMLLMPIAALHQITVFMIFGLMGAVATALLWLAPLYTNKKLTIADSANRFVSRLTERSAGLRKKRFLAVAFGLLSLLLLLEGGQLNFDDNIKNLNSSSTKLINQEQKIQSLMGYSSYPRYILVGAHKPQFVLQFMNGITKRMEATGLPLRTQALSLWIPTDKAQQSRNTQIKSFNDDGQLDLMRSYLEPQQWQAMLSKLDNKLLVDDWPAALSVLAQPLFTDGKKHYGIISYYAPLDEHQKLQIKADLPDITFFDQPQRLTESLTQVRTSLMLFFGFAACVFGLILIVRYGLKYGLFALVTPIGAALGSLIISQLIVSSMSIFNLLACLLIVALAVDYIVFFCEQGHKKHVVLAILLSAISSMAAFGMMTFSQTPAVYHFGLSTLIGIVLAVILSFITPLRPRKPDDQSM